MSRVMETVRIVAPLGLQLFSEALGRPVANALSVTLSDPAGRGRPVQLASNSVGTFVAHRLPGVSPADLLAEDWSGLVRPMRLDIIDRLGEYLPFSALVRLPQRGLLTVAALEPPLAGQTGPIPLFATPSFGPAAQAAAIRLQVAFPDGSPAAWALVTAAIDGRSYRGVTDARGSGLVAFPWPQPPRQVLPGSPPEIADYRWPVTLNVFGGRLDPRHPPDLGALLAQASGQRYRLEFPASPPVPDPPILILGRSLNLPPATLVPV